MKKLAYFLKKASIGRTIPLGYRFEPNQQWLTALPDDKRLKAQDYLKQVDSLLQSQHNAAVRQSPEFSRLMAVMGRLNQAPQPPPIKIGEVANPAALVGRAAVKTFGMAAKEAPKPRVDGQALMDLIKKTKGAFGRGEMAAPVVYRPKLGVLTEAAIIGAAATPAGRKHVGRSWEHLKKYFFKKKEKKASDLEKSAIFQQAFSAQKALAPPEERVPRVKGRNLAEFTSNIDKKIMPRAPALGGRLHMVANTLGATVPQGDYKIDLGPHGNNYSSGKHEIALSSTRPATAGHEAGHTLDKRQGMSMGDRGFLGMGGNTSSQLPSELSATRHSFETTGAVDPHMAAATGTYVQSASKRLDNALDDSTHNAVLRAGLDTSAASRPYLNPIPAWNSQRLARERGDLEALQKEVNDARRAAHQAEWQKLHDSVFNDNSIQYGSPESVLRKKKLDALKYPAHVAYDNPAEFMPALNPAQRARYQPYVGFKNIEEVANGLNRRGAAGINNLAANPRLLEHFSPEEKGVYDLYRRLMAKRLDKIGPGVGDAALQHVDDVMAKTRASPLPGIAEAWQGAKPDLESLKYFIDAGKQQRYARLLRFANRHLPSAPGYTAEALRTVSPSTLTRYAGKFLKRGSYLRMKMRGDGEKRADLGGAIAALRERLGGKKEESHAVRNTAMGAAAAAPFAGLIGAQKQIHNMDTMPQFSSVELLKKKLQEGDVLLSGGRTDAPEGADWATRNFSDFSGAKPQVSMATGTPKGYHTSTVVGGGLEEGPLPGFFNIDDTRQNSGMSNRWDQLNPNERYTVLRPKFNDKERAEFVQNLKHDTRGPVEFQSFGSNEKLYPNLKELGKGIERDPPTLSGAFYDRSKALGTGLRELFLPKRHSAQEISSEHQNLRAMSESFHGKGQTEGLKRMEALAAKLKAEGKPIELDALRKSLPKGIGRLCSSLPALALPAGKQIVPGVLPSNILPHHYLQSELFDSIGHYAPAAMRNVTRAEQVMSHSPNLIRGGVGAGFAAGIYGGAKLHQHFKKKDNFLDQLKTGAERHPTLRRLL